MRLIAARGRLMQALPAGGRWPRCWRGGDRVRAVLAPTGSGGDCGGQWARTRWFRGRPSGRALCAALEARGVGASALGVSHAFHSQLDGADAGGFERVAGGLTYEAPRIGLISNLRAGPAAGGASTRPTGGSTRGQPVGSPPAMQTLEAARVRVLAGGRSPSGAAGAGAAVQPGDAVFCTPLQRQRATRLGNDALPACACCMLLARRADWAGFYGSRLSPARRRSCRPIRSSGNASGSRRAPSQGSSHRHLWSEQRSGTRPWLPVVTKPSRLRWIWPFRATVPSGRS